MEMREENLRIKEENDTLKDINSKLKIADKAAQLDTNLIKQYKSVNEEILRKTKDKEKFNRILIKIALDGGNLLRTQSTFERLTSILKFNGRFFNESFMKNSLKMRRYLNKIREREKHNIGEILFERLNNKIKIFLKLREKEEEHFENILLLCEKRRNKLISLVENMPGYYSNFEIFKLKDFWVGKMKKIRDEKMEKITEQNTTDFSTLTRSDLKPDDESVYEEIEVEDESTEIMSDHYWSNLDVNELIKRKKKEKRRKEKEEKDRKNALKEHESGFEGQDLETVLSNSAKKYYRGDFSGVKTVHVQKFEDKIKEFSVHDDVEKKRANKVVKNLLLEMLLGEREYL